MLLVTSHAHDKPGPSTPQGALLCVCVERASCTAVPALCTHVPAFVSCVRTCSGTTQHCPFCCSLSDGTTPWCWCGSTSNVKFSIAPLSLQNGSKSGLRCVLLSDPSTLRALGVPTKTRLESSIKKFKPHFCICRYAQDDALHIELFRLLMSTLLRHNVLEQFAEQMFGSASAIVPRNYRLSDFLDTIKCNTEQQQAKPRVLARKDDLSIGCIKPQLMRMLKEPATIDRLEGPLMESLKTGSGLDVDGGGGGGFVPIDPIM